MTLELEMRLRDMGLLADTWLQELQDVARDYYIYQNYDYPPTMEMMENTYEN
jgi:uncharacterized protein Usg